MVSFQETTTTVDESQPLTGDEIIDQVLGKRPSYSKGPE